MTRKHFEALASNIRAIHDPAAREAAAVAVAAACRYSSGNPRFNIAQFYEACGVSAYASGGAPRWWEV